jgi:hypothetical protein
VAVLTVLVLVFLAPPPARVAAPPAASPASAPAPAPPLIHLESRRLRSKAVYLGTVSAVRRLGALEGLTAETQGRMEATVAVAKALRAPSGSAPPAEALVSFDRRAPEPEGDGFYDLAIGESVLVFADSFDPAYPRELLHGTPAALGAQVKALRDFVAGMDEGTMRLHGLAAPSRAAQVRLYDQALAALGK